MNGLTFWIAKGEGDRKGERKKRGKRELP